MARYLSHFVAGIHQSMYEQDRIALRVVNYWHVGDWLDEIGIVAIVSWRFGQNEQRYDS